MLKNFSEINSEDNFEIENNENLEDCIDQAMNSDDFDLMDKNWNENHTIPTKENDNTSNSSQEGANETRKFICRVCNSDFENNSILEEHVRDCFENCHMYDD